MAQSLSNNNIINEKEEERIILITYKIPFIKYYIFKRYKMNYFPMFPC